MSKSLRHTLLAAAVKLSRIKVDTRELLGECGWASAPMVSGVGSALQDTA